MQKSPPAIDSAKEESVRRTKPLSTWSGDGFPFKDGRTIARFEACASSEAEAKKMVHAVAGWTWFKKTPLRPGGSRITNVPTVWIQWEPGGRLEPVEVPKVRGKLPDARPVGGTLRVQRCHQRLLDAGGHRSTIRFTKDAWTLLSAYVEKLGLTQSQVLERALRKLDGQSVE